MHRSLTRTFLVVCAFLGALLGGPVRAAWASTVLRCLVEGEVLEVRGERGEAATLRLRVTRIEQSGEMQCGTVGREHSIEITNAVAFRRSGATVGSLVRVLEERIYARTRTGIALTQRRQFLGRVAARPAAP